MLTKLFPNCYVYIVQCSDKTLYTGITWNLRLRIRRHNGLVLGGAKYTRSRRPVFLVYFEKLESRKDAYRREGEIKAMDRIQKLELINSMSKEALLSGV